MRRRLLAVLACLLLAGCTVEPPAAKSSDASLTQSHVDVDTPALRAAKRAAGVQPCRPGSATPAEDGLPAVTLPCLGGGPAVDLSRLKGPLVINLFAQWCGPCRSELPYYERLHREAGSRLDVLGVDYLDPLPAAALALVADSRVTYPLLADPAGDLRRPFRATSLPGVVLVRADGSIDVQYRVMRSYAELRTLVEDGLDVRLPS